MLEQIREKVYAGERLTFEEGLALFKAPDILTLGELANWVKRKRHANRIYYSNNLYLNPTNICDAACVFCAFARNPDEPDAYVLSLDEIRGVVEKAMTVHGINEVHIVGGLYKELSFEYFLEMVRMIRALSPTIFIKAFTAVEIDDLAAKAGLSIRDTLLALKEAGLNGLPGGGAEIFAEETRRKICATKISSDRWLDIHRVTHQLGLHSNCTMLYGHLESDEDRVDHMVRLRALQDETGGFQSFVPLAFHPKNTPLENKVKLADAFTELRIFAVSRLMLDNIPHLKAYWTTLGVKMAQMTLVWGVDDLSGANLNEKIIHDAGAESPVEIETRELEAMVREVNLEPIQVDSSYECAAHA